MDIAILLTFLVLAGAVYLFVTEKLPVDLVAMLVLASVLALGLVTPREALSGFSSEATVTVAAMFVLSAGISRSGVLQGLGDLLGKIRWPWLFALVLMAFAAATSAFINNTAIVAVFLPLVIAAAGATGTSPSKMLIPLSYAAQFGGVCTLVGTSTNLLVHSVAQQRGLPGFTLFEFTQLGLWFVGAGTLYLLVAQRFLLPDHGVARDRTDSHAGRFVTELHVPEKSPAIGKTGSEVLPLDTGDALLLEIYRDGYMLLQPRAATVEAGDRLLVRGGWDAIEKARKALKLTFDPVARDLDGDPAEDRLHAEVMIAPGSHLAGRSLAQLRFGHTYRLRVHGLQRPGEAIRQAPHKVPLAVGDVLLVDATERAIDGLRSEPGVMLLDQRRRQGVDGRRAFLSVAIMIAVILVAALEIMSIVSSALIGCVALVALHVLKTEEAYGGIDWRVIMLLAGVLPLGIALQNSGGAEWLAHTSLRFVGEGNPLLALAIVYLLTSVMTELMSNNASAVLVAPIAIATAELMGVDSKPFLVAVAFAASTSFATPIGYQTNTMVYTAGGYRFGDFFKVGMPLNVIFFIMAVVLIPRYFPF
ncbi:MAG: SLC13 family permease [Pseudoxanthomonas suwonensis]|nr:SLC13 family permease [Pseudoxanthomonas suwonensis]